MVDGYKFVYMDERKQSCLTVTQYNILFNYRKKRIEFSLINFLFEVVTCLPIDVHEVFL